jgi:hypothetical protein
MTKIYCSISKIVVFKNFISKHDISVYLRAPRGGGGVNR